MRSPKMLGRTTLDYKLGLARHGGRCVICGGAAVDVIKGTLQAYCLTCRRQWHGLTPLERRVMQLELVK